MTTDPTDTQAEPETEEPVAPVSTDPTDLNADPESNEPAAPVTSDPTDPQFELETEEPELELELELVQSHTTQKPVLRGKEGACRFTQLTSTAPSLLFYSHLLLPF